MAYSCVSAQVVATALKPVGSVLSTQVDARMFAPLLHISYWYIVVKTVGASVNARLNLIVSLD
jgi:hypothetical protein